MKFTYAYKTSDGTRHEESMDAESREAVFAALRQQGIKAIKVVAADGSKANGEVRGIRKRVVAAAVLGALCLVLGAVVVVLLGRGGGVIDPALPWDSTVRRQVVGDAAVIEKGVRTGWSDVFESEGERFLASFAIPGVKAGQRATTEEELRRAIDPDKRWGHRFPQGGETLEARQIVAMVEGMKAELRAYLAAGGTIVGYGKRLTERQDAEIAIYERMKAELDAAKKTMDEDAFLEFWESRNAELRNLGIRLVPLE